ncbi:type II toxin-antitoxin system MqsA family antitoxin, partial [Cupriavidus plantarum]
LYAPIPPPPKTYRFTYISLPIVRGPKSVENSGSQVRGALEQKMICPTCGAAEMTAATRDVPYRYKGLETVVRDVTGLFCPVCGESVTDAKESEAVMRQMLAFKREIDGRP